MELYSRKCYTPIVFRGTRIGTLLICLLHLFAAGCAPGKTVSSTPPPPTELVMPAEPSPEPTPQNPVSAVFERFLAFAEPVSAALAQQADIRALPCALSLDMQMQRLKQVFSVFCTLPEAGEAYWEGMLVGAVQGTASITASEDGCSFSAVFWDGTKIEGGVSADAMRADWLYSETITPEAVVTEDSELPDRRTDPETVWHLFRSADISLEEDAAAASLYWEDGYAGLLLRGGGIHYAQARTQPVNTALQPERWADWSYVDGAIYTHARDANVDGAPPDETVEEAQTGEAGEAAQQPRE